jgi:hypothetical protein
MQQISSGYNRADSFVGRPGRFGGSRHGASGIKVLVLDLSHEQPDAPLPEAVAAGAEPYLIVGAMAGGQFRPPPRQLSPR